jgi:hypothetical protein
MRGDTVASIRRYYGGMKWTSLSCGGMFLLSAVMAFAQVRVLTALDYIEIQQLMYRYAMALDTCSNEGYDYADLYTADGVFMDKFSPDAFAKGGIVLGKGRDGLAKAAGGGPEGCKKPADGGMATKVNGASVAWNGWTHIMADPVITPTAKGATGRVYLIMLNTEGPNTINREGGYEDIYVKTQKGWRIQQRTHVRTRAWHNPKLQTSDLQ